MAERSKEQYGNSNSKNNSGETAIATTRESSKIKIKEDDLVAKANNENG